ncbi:MAG: alpha-amylase, partial [Muribaculaceae bacterium]|nr:alpha-amylase [Muribaculaceae bacterium]
MPIRAYADSSFEANRTDFRDETIYFAMTTRFYDGDPKNNVLSWDGQEDQIKNGDPVWRGDFAGLIKKLDYIKALGFTAIWITPIVQNASGFDYHGYHAMDFSNVDLRYESRKEWGCEEDVKFEDLIKAAHKKGIKIILDIVLQHTGNFGEAKFCKLFDRDQKIWNQADIESCLIPVQDKLGGSDYWKLPNDGPKTQYSERFKYMKNTDGQNHD